MNSRIDSVMGIPEPWTAAKNAFRPKQGEQESVKLEIFQPYAALEVEGCESSSEKEEEEVVAAAAAPVGKAATRRRNLRRREAKKASKEAAMQVAAAEMAASEGAWKRDAAYGAAYVLVTGLVGVGAFILCG